LTEGDIAEYKKDIINSKRDIEIAQAIMKKIVNDQGFRVNGTLAKVFTELRSEDFTKEDDIEGIKSELGITNYEFNIDNYNNVIGMIRNVSEGKTWETFNDVHKDENGILNWKSLWDGLSSPSVIFTYGFGTKYKPSNGKTQAMEIAKQRAMSLAVSFEDPSFVRYFESEFGKANESVKIAEKKFSWWEDLTDDYDDILDKIKPITDLLEKSGNTNISRKKINKAIVQLNEEFVDVNFTKIPERGIAFNKAELLNIVLKKAISAFEAKIREDYGVDKDGKMIMTEDLPDVMSKRSLFGDTSLYPVVAETDNFIYIRGEKGKIFEYTYKGFG
jgi:hypothetical protein